MTESSSSTTAIDKGTSREKSSLRILQSNPAVTTLRGSGPFVEPLTWQNDRENHTPRALRALSKIVDGGLCHRCGSCIGICPTGVLGLDYEDYPAVQNLSACTDCDLCVKVCPGDEFNLIEAYHSTFGVSPDVTSTHGHFE